MTYVPLDPETAKSDIDFCLDLSAFENILEEHINKVFSAWLRESRLNTYLIPGYVVAEIEGAVGDEQYAYLTDYAEFFDRDNEFDGDFEAFLLFGLKVFRDRYKREPGEPRDHADEADRGDRQ